jgi:hypothetical protein
MKFNKCCKITSSIQGLFLFANAKHINLCAPCFLQNLVSKINAQKHVSKDFERYLFYNMINEFKLFFESIGVKSSKINKSLPHGKIYLNEDEFLLVKVSTLSNTGFPRHVLGKIYKLQKKCARYHLSSFSSSSSAPSIHCYKSGSSALSLILIHGFL